MVCSGLSWLMGVLVGLVGWLISWLVGQPVGFCLFQRAVHGFGGQEVFKISPIGSGRARRFPSFTRWVADHPGPTRFSVFDPARERPWVV